MKLECGRPLREWLRSPIRTFLAFRNCVRIRGGMTTNIAKIEILQWSADPELFSRKYFRKGKRKRIKIQPEAEKHYD